MKFPNLSSLFHLGNENDQDLIARTEGVAAEAADAAEYTAAQAAAVEATVADVSTNTATAVAANVPDLSRYDNADVPRPASLVSYEVEDREAEHTDLIQGN